jgi:hypothetical protein
MSKTWVLCALAACSVAVPVAVGDTAPAQGAKPADTPGKGNGKTTTTVAAPAPPAAPAPAPAPAAPAPAPAAPAPAPPADDKGKDKDKPAKDPKAPKDPKNGASTTAPGKTVVPPAAPAAPGASAAPTVAFDTPTLAPTLGESVGVAAAQGTVVVRTADGRGVRPLNGAAAIPTGARVDARAGTVELSSAVAADGTPQTATFTGAIFEVHQDQATGLTRILLKGGDFSACKATKRRAGTAVAAAKKKRKPVRSLWGKDDHGSFQTTGKGAVGTVRGTRWLTQDFCDGTLTRVVEGSVAVRDLRTGKTVVVRAGHSYFARYKA